jgi:rhodanese-related sulfurtransferase
MLVVLLLLSCSDPQPKLVDVESTALEVGSRSDVDVIEFAALHAQGVKVLDVRTPEEYSQGRVPGAILVPISELSESHPMIVDLTKSEPVYVVCHSGGRSARAADTLASLGFVAVNVTGGTTAWMAKGYQVER